MKIIQVAKSKTVTISAAYFALFEILGAFEIEIPQRAALGGFVILCWILRRFTTIPLDEK